MDGTKQYRNAFVAFWRSILEYYTPVWPLYLVSDMKISQNVQRRVTRIAFGKIYMHISLILPAPYPRRRKHQFQFLRRCCSTSNVLRSFLFRARPVWDLLPVDKVSASTSSHLKLRWVFRHMSCCCFYVRNISSQNSTFAIVSFVLAIHTDKLSYVPRPRGVNKQTNKRNTTWYQF